MDNATIHLPLGLCCTKDGPQWTRSTRSTVARPAEHPQHPRQLSTARLTRGQTRSLRCHLQGWLVALQVTAASSAAQHVGSSRGLLLQLYVCRMDISCRSSEDEPHAVLAD